MDQQGSYKFANSVTGIKIGTLQSMVFRKQIPHFRVGKRLVLFRREDLEQWLKSRHVAVLSDNAASPKGA